MSLKCEHIFLQLGGNTILSDVSLALAPARVTALLGCNGAGKSSLLKILAGDLAASVGQVTLDQKPLADYRPRELAKRRAVLTQKSSLSFAFPVYQIVAMGAAHCALPKGKKREIISLLLRLTGIDQLALRDYTSLSGGEQQRVHFARTLAQLWVLPNQLSPILILDEPVAALDFAWQQRVLEITQWLAHKKHWSVLVVLHDMNQAASYADEVFLLKDGHCLSQGSPLETLQADNLNHAFSVLSHVQQHPLVSERPHIIPIRADLPPIECYLD